MKELNKLRIFQSLFSRVAKQCLKLSDIENSKANKGKKNQSKLIKSLFYPVVRKYKKGDISKDEKP